MSKEMERSGLFLLFSPFSFSLLTGKENTDHQNTEKIHFCPNTSLPTEYDLHMEGEQANRDQEKKNVDE